MAGVKESYSKRLKCGKKRIWMDPNEANEIGLANSSKPQPSS